MLVRVENCVVLGGVRYNRGTHEIKDSVCRGDVFDRLVKFRKVIVVEPLNTLVSDTSDTSDTSEEAAPKKRGRKPKGTAIIDDGKEPKADDAEATEEPETQYGE